MHREQILKCSGIEKHCSKHAYNVGQTKCVFPFAKDFICLHPSLLLYHVSGIINRVRCWKRFNKCARYEKSYGDFCNLRNCRAMMTSKKETRDSDERCARVDRSWFEIFTELIMKVPWCQTGRGGVCARARSFSRPRSTGKRLFEFLA